jgi:hypothetical protein
MALSKSEYILLAVVSHDEEIAGFKRFIRLTEDCHVASLATLAITFIYFTANAVSTSVTIVKNKKRKGI